MSGSGFLMEQPVVIQGSREEAGGVFGNAQPLRFMPSVKNYASDEKTAALFRDEISPIMRWTRQDRRGLEAEWSDIENMNAMKHDSGRRYFGRSDSYMPLYKRERAKMISTWTQGLFPSEEYFDVTDRGTGDPAAAKPVKVYMQYEFETNAKIRSYMKPFLGTLADFGTSPMKFWYKKTIRNEGGATRNKLLNGLLGRAQYGFKPQVQEGLKVSPRSLFFWYVYPSTCESLDDAQMVFEDLEVPIAFVEWMHRTGRWINCADIVASGTNAIVPEHEMNRQQILTQRGEGLQVPGRSGMGGPSGLQVTITECWTYMVLPRDAYMEGEDPRLPIPVLVICAGDGGGLGTPVDIRRNPFFHQRPPYAASRVDWTPGMYYGNAQGKIIKPLQMLTNDFMNQTNDNGIMGLNPIALIDITKMAGTPTSYYPGAAWYTMGPDAVKFDRPPIDQTEMGMHMTNMIMGLAQDLGGSPPDYGSKSRAGNTATGMSIAQKNTQAPLSSTVRDIEDDTMLPILIGGWKNAVQYRDEAVMVSVAGEQIKVDPEMLAIDAEFRYLASSQAQNAQVRTQQMMQLIQGIMPMVPMIMQQGYIINFVAILKRVWVDGFGFRGFNEFIQKAQAVPGAGGPAPEQMGGVQAEQQNNLRSALEQVNGHFDESAQAQPGEAQDFSEVRNNADQIAALGNGYNGTPS